MIAYGVMRIVSVAVMLCGAAARLPGQPGISQNGVVNLASRIPPTLAGGAIARGALLSIYGIRLGSTDHTAVTLSHGGNAIGIQIVSIFPRRIEALMPRTAPLGSGSVTVTVDGKPSKAFPVMVVDSNPGIFARNGEGWGPGRIDNIDASASRTANSTSNPARPGARVVLVTTGLGNAKKISLMVGARAARAEAPRPTSKLGEEELAFRIPTDAPEGCYVPLYLRLSDNRASNIVSMAIRSRPGPCDPSPFPTASAARVGVLILSRTRMRAIREGAPESVADDARIAFIATAEQSAPMPIQLPPTGTCSALTSSYQTNTSLSNSILSVVRVEGRGLDAGKTLLLSRANQTRSISQSWEGQGIYRKHLGAHGYDVHRLEPPLFLEPGDFTLLGTGGVEIGRFTTAFSVPAPFEWTDREQIRVVDRSRGVTVHWKNATPEQTMVILARNIDQITTAIGMCICTASAAAGQFTIPAPPLSNVPASQDVAGVPYEELAVGSLTMRPGIKASGLSGGFGVFVYAVGRFVQYR
jgi:uncharacterized protein (TIGR03437 family)